MFTLVNFSEFSGKTKLSRFSRAVNIALISVYTLFFLVYPVYRLLLQRYFTVKSMKAQHAMNKARSKIARDKKRAQRMKQLEDYEEQSPGARPEDDVSMYSS